MTSEETTETKDAVTEYEQKQAQNKEYNFRALEQKLQREAEARQEAERKIAEYEERLSSNDDDDDLEPYVDHKKLQKKLTSFERDLKKSIQSEAKNVAHQMMSQNKQETWMKNNPDFYDVIKKHADQFAAYDPELAETILEMPDTFERQKLVYKNIKALKLHEPPKQEPSIQDKIDANRRSPYYQPSNVSSAPYSAQGDFSPAGRKQAYEKMKELQGRLRLG